MGTLANQAKIGVWVQAPGALLRMSSGYTPRKKSCETTQNPAI